MYMYVLYAYPYAMYSSYDVHSVYKNGKDLMFSLNNTIRTIKRNKIKDILFSYISSFPIRWSMIVVKKECCFVYASNYFNKIICQLQSK